MYISINDVLFLSVLLVFLVLTYARIIHNRVSFELVSQTYHGFDKKQRRKTYIKQINKRPADFQKVVLTEVSVLSGALIIMFLVATKAIFFTAVVSGSMSPTFDTDDLVLMENIDHSYKPGDIIMFERPDTSYPVAHRIKMITDLGIYTAGDATDQIDWWELHKEDIHGKAVLIQGSPIVLKSLGKFFIIDQSHQDFGPFGQDYRNYILFFQVVKIYGYAIAIICLLLYIVMTLRKKQYFSGKDFQS
jgi:signal peptidase I